MFSIINFVDFSHHFISSYFSCYCQLNVKLICCAFCLFFLSILIWWVMLIVWKQFHVETVIEILLFFHTNLIFCKFVRNYIDSTELIFTVTCISDEHEILVKNTDKKHRWFLAYENFKIAKEIMIQLIEQIVCWCCDDEEISVLKKVVINVNNDSLILHFKNVEHKRKNACTFY